MNKFRMLAVIFTFAVALPLFAQDHFAANGYANIAPMNGERGVYHNGKTYVVYPGSDATNTNTNDPYIACYDHAAGIWEGPVKVAENLLVADYHGHPGVVVDDNGYILVVFGGHNEFMSVSRSTNPEDISSWNHLNNLPDTETTYPKLLKMSDGTIYCFYRKKTHAGHWTYITTTDGGLNWSGETYVLDGDPANTTHGWYSYFMKEPGADRVHVAYHLHHHHGSAGPNSRQNAYYMYMNHSDQIWRNVQGQAQSTPVDFAGATSNTLVVDSGGVSTRLPNVAITTTGQLVYGSHITGSVGEYRCYTWNGSQWVYTTPAVSVDQFRAGPGDSLVGYATGSDVKRYISNDYGATWVLDRTAITGALGYYSMFIEGGHADGELFIMEDVQQVWGEQKVYLWGASGLVARTVSTPSPPGGGSGSSSDQSSSDSGGCAVGVGRGWGLGALVALIVLMTWTARREQAHK